MVTKPEEQLRLKRPILGWESRLVCYPFKNGGTQSLKIHEIIQLMPLRRKKQKVEEKFGRRDGGRLGEIIEV